MHEVTGTVMIKDRLFALLSWHLWALVYIKLAQADAAFLLQPSSANSSAHHYKAPAQISSGGQSSRIKICIARDQDFADQIGSHQWFDMMDPEKVTQLCLDKIAFCSGFVMISNLSLQPY